MYKTKRNFKSPFQLAPDKKKSEALAAKERAHLKAAVLGLSQNTKKLRANKKSILKRAGAL